MPFVIGVAGSVAVGKSTTARVLQALLARWEHHPRVDLVTTDGFLYPNAELTRRNLMHRKGFPESYDRRALMRFVTTVKSGAANGGSAFDMKIELLHAGVFNGWIEKSLGRLAELVPGRYARSEQSSGFLASIETYAYRRPAGVPGVLADGSGRAGDEPALRAGLPAGEPGGLDP